MREDGIGMIMDYVQGVVGISIANGRAKVFEKKVVERQQELGIENPFSYYLFLKHRAPDTEIVELVDRLVVSETYFYRESEQCDVLREEILAMYTGSRTDRNRTIRILSAGCSSGEEPYTLAMIVLEQLGDLLMSHDIDVKIVACDINTKSLAKAAEAQYDEWSIRHLPRRYRDEYLTCTNGVWEVNEQVRNLVEFCALNLNDGQTWTHRHGFLFDIAFCRNVLIYFADDRAKMLIDGLFEVIRPGGFLFTASTESLQRHSDRFSMERINDIFIYRK